MASSELMYALGIGFLSDADALALLSYLPLVAGLIRLTQARFRESALDTLLVAAIVPASLGVFAWLPLVEAVRTGRRGVASLSAYLAVTKSLVRDADAAIVLRHRRQAQQDLVAAFRTFQSPTLDA